jgi:hypothetical protein
LLNAIAALAQSTANTASSNASSAVTTANSASTAATNAQNTANSAATAASNAATAASNAQAAVDYINSDNAVSPSERPQLLQLWVDIYNERTDIYNKLTTYSLITERNNYDTAYSNLLIYLTSTSSSIYTVRMPNPPSVSSTWAAGSTVIMIVGSEMRTVFSEYYKYKILALNAMSAAAKTLADNAQGSANTAISNASAANTAATNAATAAADRLSKSANNILAGSGALIAGTLVTNSAGSRVSGSGMAITSQGIAGYDSGGTATFAISTNGSAVFKGDLTGASGTFSGTVAAGNTTDGLILDPVTKTLKVYDSGTARVTVGNLGSAVYGVRGTNTAGAETFRLDENGLLSYPKAAVLNMHGTSYNMRVILEGKITQTNTVSGTITNDIQIPISSNGAFRVYVNVVGYYENATYSVSSALSSILMGEVYFNNATSAPAYMATQYGIGDTTDTTNFNVSGRVQLVFSSGLLYLRLNSRSGQGANAKTYYRYIVSGMDDGFYPAFTNNYG